MKYRGPTGTGRQSEHRGGGVGYKADLLRSEFCKVKMLRIFCTFRKEYVVGFLLLLAVTIIWIWAFNTNSFAKPDALDYAQMGRELGNGNGLSTLQIFPRHIRLFYQKGYLEKENWPNLYRYPLPTILNAFFYKITDDIIKAAVLQSGIAFLLSIPLLFILATRLTNLKVGIISIIFYAADPVIFTGSYEAMTEPMAALLLLWLFLIAFSGQLSPWKCFAMGIICGLSCLNRAQFILLVPLAALYIWINLQKKKKFAGFVLLLVALLLVVGPWFIRNTVVVGEPAFSFSTSRNLVKGSSPIHSDLEMQLEAPTETLEVFKKYGPAIAKKALKNLSTVVRLNFWAGNFSPKGSIFLFFLFASFIYRRHSANRKYDYFRNAAATLIFCNFLVISLAFLHKMRFYTPLMPLIYIVGINEIFMFFGNSRFKYSGKLKQVVFYGMLLFGMVRLYNAAMIQKNSHLPVSAQENKSYELIRQVAAKNTIVASNIPATLALYVGCRALSLPAFPIELLKINDNYLPIDYVLITGNVLNADPSEKPSLAETYTNYSEFVKSDEFLKTFKFIKELPDGAMLFERLQK